MSTNSNILASLGNQFQSFNDWHVTAAILWTGVVTTALTSFVENFAMKNLSASESTIIYSTEPLWGTAFAAVTLNESIGWNTVLGAILILAACVWSSVGPVIGTGLLSSSFSSFSEKMVEIHETTIKNVIEFYENSQIYSPEP
jgi:drug/metabolite transporter (DMT)-like permease